MAGTARTDRFLLSTATVMVGALADLHSFQPNTHSIGLVKNFTLTSDPGYVELTQGIKNTVVMSIRNQDGIKAACEVYEYTVRNLAYAAGLDASGVSFDPMPAMWISSGAAAPAAVVITVASDITSNLAAGDYIFLQDGIDDSVHIAKVLTAVFATATTTITFATGYGVPAGKTFPIGTRIGKIKRIDLGGVQVQAEMAVKVVGILPKDNSPFTILLPRVKITKGLSVGFQTDNFGNLPFEFTPYAGVPTDPMYPFYGEAAAVLFPR
ncbi:hypothetical protein [Mesorhizobium sp. STM 4661]|uniref:hypothetical protein n=1 Tax=Mesorhizobium sp. STM 4661 TaxID=1297570 RepID=UPI0002BFFFD7|nr:hypothetical protein [Mesorhizobium sp. STM 4661]CCV12935.1 hypothetical protein MESS4_510102 [Mesorhizobium sp. STM 4661]